MIAQKAKFINLDTWTKYSESKKLRDKLFGFVSWLICSVGGLNKSEFPEFLVQVHFLNIPRSIYSIMLFLQYNF